MKRKNKNVYGWGTNDVDYPVMTIVNGKQKICPFYRVWSVMIRRCQDKEYKQKNPTYSKCRVDERWRSFSKFKSWMECQDWKGKNLDKDILSKGDKVYSPETCVFVHGAVNKFITDSGRTRGVFPIGVNYHKASGKFVAQCNNPFKNKREHLGLFTCEIEAHLAWKRRKHELAIELSNSEYVTDDRVREVLSTRYSSETDWLSR